MFDIYKEFLTEKQIDIFKMYFFEDFSITEISISLSISKAAVHDSLKNTQSQLLKYEEKLQIKEKNLLLEKQIFELEKIFDLNPEISSDLKKVIENLKKISQS